MNRPDVLADAQLATGARLDKTGAGRKVRTRVLDGNPMLIGPRWQAATARVSRILEHTSVSSSLLGATQGAGPVSKLAREFAELWSFYMTRDKPRPVWPTCDADHNEFRGMHPKDASRLLVRRVEDICDRSTGQLGPWWVR